MIEKDSLVIKESNYKYFKIDNYPGVILDSEMEFEQLDLSVKIYMTQITVFVESYGFTIQLTSSSKSIKDENRRILYLMANSILFPDQYKWKLF